MKKPVKKTTEKQLHVVTAFVKDKGQRDTISKPMSEYECVKFVHRQQDANKIALPKYRSFSKFKVEPAI